MRVRHFLSSLFAGSCVAFLLLLGPTVSGQDKPASKIVCYIGGDNKPGVFIYENGFWYDYGTDGRVSKFAVVIGKKRDDFAHLYRQREDADLFVRLYKTEAYQSDQKGNKGDKLYDVYWRKGDVK